MAQRTAPTHVTRHDININDFPAFLEGVSYPATKREILDIAFDNGAPDHMLEFLNTIPDQEYFGLTDLLFTLEDIQNL